MISVRNHIVTANRVVVTLHVQGADLDDLEGVGGTVRVTADGALVTWDQARVMTPPNAVAVYEQHVTDVLTANALSWLGGGAVIDMGAES